LQRDGWVGDVLQRDAWVGDVADGLRLGSMVRWKGERAF
jgi:hypothetical protein